MNTSFFRDLLEQIVEQGRGLSPSLRLGNEEETFADCARHLLSSRGESSGVALAQSLFKQFNQMGADEQLKFFTFINQQFSQDHDQARQAVEIYLQTPTAETVNALNKATDSPRQELFRRLNLAPGGTAAIVAMRAKLLTHLKQHPELKTLDDDIVHLLNSWFNRGFLVMQRIDWKSRANILEKIIAYEAVHEIDGWEDLKRRLDPKDRRCYAFFHPSLIDEPLIFVEVALTNEIPSSIHSLIEDRDGNNSPEQKIAVFYSISNCQKGLAGISFGNFLIKQVAINLSTENNEIKKFVTLSPIPDFIKWLNGEQQKMDPLELIAQNTDTLKLLQQPNWQDNPNWCDQLQPVLEKLIGYYMFEAKRPSGEPVDPVARFHLGNGAILEQFNWLADLSPRGIEQSASMMVNYLYELQSIEQNHEAYAERCEIAASTKVKKILFFRKPLM